MNFLTTIAELAPAVGFVLLILFILFNSFELKKREPRKNTAKTSKPVNAKWYYPVFVFFILLFLTEITKPIHGFSLLPKVLTHQLFNLVLIRIAGVVVILLSVLMLKITLNHFGTSLRFGLNHNNIAEIVTTGIFSRSRNPFFLSLLLFFSGTALVMPNLFFAIFAVSAFVGIHFSILKEERFMLQVHGNKYITYQQRVRRYF